MPVIVADNAVDGLNSHDMQIKAAQAAIIGFPVRFSGTRDKRMVDR